MESRPELFQPTFEGWCAWAILRPDAITRFAQLPMTRTARPDRLYRATRALGDIARLLRPGRARYLVKTYSSGLSEESEGAYRDVWFDDLILALGGAYKVEQINNLLFARRSARAVVPPRHTNELIDGVVAGTFARLVTAPGAREAAAALHPLVAGAPDLARYDVGFIAQVLSSFHWASRAWTRLLRRVQPEVVMVAGPTEFALTAAARRSGIPVVEMQHGLNDPAHHAQYAWPAAAREWKAKLPIPDRLFAYGDHWRERLRSGGFWADEVVSVGSSRIDRHRRLGDIRPTDRCRIVVTTQGLDVDPLLDFLRQWLSLCSDDAGIEVIVRLHPAYEGDRTRYLDALGGDPRARVLLGSEPPSTLQLLASAHLHASISSTCHYEALALGTPTVVLPFATHGITLQMREAGHAYFVRTPEELRELVARWRDLTVPSEVGGYYFAPDAVSRAQEELARLASSRRDGVR